MPGHQMSLFEGERRKVLGRSRVEANSIEWIDEIRAAAKRRCHRYGQVSIDDLRVYADTHDRHPHHRNSWGAVFKGAEWIAVGYVKSRYTTNNARRITVWRLRE